MASDIPLAPKLADGLEDQPIKYDFDQLDFLPNDSLIVSTRCLLVYVKFGEFYFPSLSKLC